MQVNNKLNALTSLRFMAAALIVIEHADELFGLIPKDKSLPLNQGVSFFFVLSGFILAWNYPALDGSLQRFRFWGARFARIWPLHAATCLLWIGLVFEFDRATHFPETTGLVKLVVNLLLMQAWVPVHEWILSFNGVAWSISAEFFFYAVFPMLLAAWSKQWQRLLFCQALMLVSLICLAPYTAFGLREVLYFHPITRVFEFSMGIALSMVVRRILTSGFSLEPPKWLVFELGALFSCELGLVVASNPSAIKNFFGEAAAFYFSNAGLWPLWMVVIGVFALSQGPVARLLSTRAGIFLGEISFALYLCHALIIHYLDGYRSDLQAMGWWAYSLFWMACIAMSTLLFYGVETPWRRIILSRVRPGQRLQPAIFMHRREALALALLGMTSGFMFFMKPSTIVPLDAPVINDFVASAMRQKLNLEPVVVFDGRYDLIALHVRQNLDVSGDVQVSALIRAKQSTHANDVFALHLNGVGGTMKANFDRKMDFGSLSVPAGTAWLHTITIPKAQWKDVQSLGVAMYAKPSKLFDVVGGNSDWGGKRLIIPYIMPSP